MSYDNDFRPEVTPRLGKSSVVDEKVRGEKVTPDVGPDANEKLSGVSATGPIEGGRAGDNMIDRPVSRPQAAPEKPSPTFSPVARDADKEKSEVRIDDLVHHSEIKHGGWFSSSFWALSLGLILALLLLYVFSHAVAILHDALVLPEPSSWIAVGLLALLLGVIVYIVIRALYFTLRLGHGSQLSIDQLVSITNFSGLRAYRLATEEFLKPYLRDFINRPQTIRKKFARLCNSDDIETAARRLLDDERRLGSREWVNEFVENIQLPLEELANRRISRYAKAAALKTAISPWPLIDMAAVIYNSVLMLGDLAIIFNRRFSRGDTVRIVTGMLFTIFIAGHTQEAVEAIGNEFSHLVPDSANSLNQADHVASMSDSIFADFGHSALLFTKFSTKKIGEGMASWMLMKRLGRYSVKMLKPIAGSVQ